MPGTRMFWRKSKTFKIIAVILPLPILLISFLIGRINVAASSAYDYNTEEITVTDQGITYAGRLTPEYLVDSDYNILMHLVPYIPSPGSIVFDPTDVTGDIFAVYTGTISISHQYTFSLTSDVNVYHDGYITGFISDNASIATNTGVTGGLSGTFVSRVTVNDIDVSCNSSLSTNPRIGSVSNTSVTIWDMVDVESEFLASGTLRHNYNVNLSVAVKLPSDFADANTDWSTLMNSYIVPTCSTSYASATLYGSPYNLREILEHIDTKLYNQWVNENLIYSTLTNVYTTDQQILTAIQNLRDSLELDDSRIIQAIQLLQQQLHSDNTTTQDILQYDHSSWSSDMYDWRDDFQAIQASADSAVDGAYLDYTNDLASVDSASWHNVLSGQSRESNFWRALGEYILNPTNLGYVAGGLLVVSLLSLFVFLLRL